MKRTLLLPLLGLFTIFTYSQEAENLYRKQYSKLGMVLQPSWLSPDNLYGNDNRSNYPSVDFTNAFSYQFGVSWNFAQSGAFNFKTGVIAKEYSPVFDLNIKQSDLGSGNVDFNLTELNPFNQFVISIPFRTEYFLKINDKINFVAGLGISYNTITGIDDNILVNVLIGEGNNSETVFRAESKGFGKNVISTEGAIGVTFKTNFALFQFDYLVSTALIGEPLRARYVFENLNNTPDTKGEFSSSLDYQSLSLTITPKKSWLKKKKN